MPIRLVPNIPHDLVMRRIEYIVKSYCKLYHSEASPEVSAENRNVINDIFPQVFADLDKIALINFFEIVRGVNLREQFAWFDIHIIQLWML